MNGLVPEKSHHLLNLVVCLWFFGLHCTGEVGNSDRLRGGNRSIGYLVNVVSSLTFGMLGVFGSFW